MAVYTSYYAKAKDLSENNYLFIRISTSAPKWWKKPLLNMPELYPGWELVDGVKRGIIDEEEYTKKYIEALNKLDRPTIIEKIYLAAINSSSIPERQNRDIILLCYETPDKFCHRHVLADWIGKVKEFEDRDKDEKGIASFERII